MAIPVTLSMGASLVVTDPGAIIGEVMQYFCAAPATMGELFPELSISFPEIISRYSSSPQAIVTPIRAALTDCLMRIFGTDAVVDLDISPQIVDERNYNLTFSLMMAYNGVTYRLSSKVLTVKNGLLVTANSLAADPQATS